MNFKKYRGDKMSEFKGVRFPKNFKLNFTTKIQKYTNPHWNKELEQYEITIQELRRLYEKDIEAFYVVCSEIYLKGGQFFLNSKNKLLFPEISYDSNCYISQVPKDKDAYKKINYSIINIEQKMNKLNIKNNHFYQGLYLDGFQYLEVSKQGIQYLIQEFQDRGFVIENIPMKTQTNSSVLKEDKNTVSKENKSITSMVNEEEIAEKENWWEDVIVEDILPMIPKPLMIIKSILSLYRHQWIVEISQEHWQDILKNQFVSKQECQSFIDLMQQMTEENFKALLSPSMPIKEEQMDHQKKNIHIEEVKEEKPKIEKREKEQVIWDMPAFLAKHPILKEVSIFKFLDKIPLQENRVFHFFYPFRNRTFVDISTKEWQQRMIEMDVNNSNIKEIENLLIRFSSSLKEKASIPRLQKKDVLDFWKLSEDQLNDIEILHQKLQEWINTSSKKIPPMTLKDALQILNVKLGENYTSEQKMRIEAFLNKPIIKLCNNISNLKQKNTAILLIIIAMYTLLLQDSPKLECFVETLPPKLQRIAITIIEGKYSGKSDEDLSQELGMTSVRFNQLQKEIKDEVKKHVQRLGYLRLIAFLLEHKKMISLSDRWMNLLYFIDADVCKSSSFVMYKEARQAVISLKDHMRNLLSQQFVMNIKEFRQEMGVVIKKENVSLSNFADYTTLLDQLQLRLVDDKYIIKKDPQRIEQIAIVLCLYFENKIQLTNKKDIQKFRDKFQLLFPDQVFFSNEDSDEQIAEYIGSYIENAKIQKLQSLIYQPQIEKVEASSNSVRLPDNFIEKMHSFIQQELKKYPVVYNQKLYRVFGEEFSTHLGYEVKDYRLYSSLKIKYKDEYDFDSEGLLKIFPKGQKLTDEEILIQLLQRNKGFISIDELCAHLYLSKTDIMQILQNVYTDSIKIVNNNLVLGKKRVEQTIREKEVNKNYNINEIKRYSDVEKNEKEQVRLQKNVMDNIIQKKKYSTHPLKRLMEEDLENYQFIAPKCIYYRLSLENPAFIQKNNINEENIAQKCRELDPSLRGTQQLLSYSKSEDPTKDLFTYFRKYMGEKEYYSISELKEVFSMMGYTSTVTAKLKEASEKQYIYQVKLDYFIYPDQLLLSNEQKEEVQAFIESYFVEKDYLSLILDIRSYKLRKLSQKLDISLTPYLLAHLLSDQLGYELLSVSNIQLSNNPLLIVKKGTYTLETLFKELMISYKGENIEEEILHYLKECHVIVESNNLPSYVCKALDITVDSHTKKVKGINFNTI